MRLEDKSRRVWWDEGQRDSRCKSTNGSSDFQSLLFHHKALNFAQRPYQTLSCSQFETETSMLLISAARFPAKAIIIQSKSPTSTDGPSGNKTSKTHRQSHMRENSFPLLIPAQMNRPLIKSN